MLCCIFNYAPHYRSVIYKKMSEELHADFYFGENLKFKGETIKKIDINKLEGFKKEFHIKYFKFFIDFIV